MTTLSNVEEKHIYFDRNFFDLYSGGPIDNMSSFVQIMVWHRIGAKPIAESKESDFTGACMRHQRLTREPKFHLVAICILLGALFNACLRPGSWQTSFGLSSMSRYSVQILTGITHSASLVIEWGATGGFPSQRASDVKLWLFFDISLIKLVNKPYNHRWFETSWGSYDVAEMLFGEYATTALPSNLWYKSHLSRQWNCWSLRHSWSIACRRCSIYIFIHDLTLGFYGLGKDNIQDKTRNT